MYVLSKDNYIDFDNQYTLGQLINVVWSKVDYKGNKPYSFGEVVTLANSIGYAIYTVS